MMMLRSADSLETAAPQPRRRQTLRARIKHLLLLLLLSGGAIVAAHVSAADANPGLTAEAAAPDDAPSDPKRLIGEYRSASADALTIYEADGQLRAEGLGLHQAPLRRLTATRFSVEAPQKTRVQFELDRDG